MLDVLDDIIRRHRQGGILLDTNILILLLMALWDRPTALSFKANSNFSEGDVDTLSLLVSQFNRVVVTPGVLAEVANLADRLPEPNRTKFFEFLQGMLPTPSFEERLISLPLVAGSECFTRLGFTDATLEQLGVAGVPVLTNDRPLYVHLLAQHIDVLNFDVVRALLS